MNTIATKKVFKAIHEVLEVVDTSDFIREIYKLKENYKANSFQDILINDIISTTCREVGIKVHDVTHTKEQYNGKRIKSTGIIIFLIKNIYPELSYNYICGKLNDNVSKSNAIAYSKMFKELDPKLGKKDKELIDRINLQILNKIQDEELRCKQKEV